jgi:hypothetical protein
MNYLWVKILDGKYTHFLFTKKEKCYKIARSLTTVMHSTTLWPFKAKAETTEMPYSKIPLRHVHGLKIRLLFFQNISTK